MIHPYRSPLIILPPAETATTHEGGTVFKADKWLRLRRWLILGSEGTFYANARDLTIENVAVVRECLVDDPIRTLSVTVAVHDGGLAAKQEPALLALAMATLVPDDQARSLAMLNVPRFCRTGTQLLHFVMYRKALGGKWNRSLRRAVGAWFNRRDAEGLAYQAVKYQSRDGWSLKDLLILAHPTPRTPEHNAVFAWIMGQHLYEPSPPLIIQGANVIKALPNEPAGVIRSSRLPREAVPTELLNDPNVWDALLDDMPIQAMIRNLGKMTSVGLLSEELTVGMIRTKSAAALKIVERLADRDRLRQARIHPITVLAALKVYEQGRGERGKLTWEPVKSIVEALNEAFYGTFENVPSSGKTIRLALDVSASMDGNMVNGMPFLDARMASAAFALVTVAREPDVHVVAFSHRLEPITLRGSMRLDEVLRKLKGLPHGGTYCQLPVVDAYAHDAKVDAFVTFTDSETMGFARQGSWYGARPLESWVDVTVAQALEDYRQRRGKPVKYAVMAVCANELTLADPRDPDSLDVVGLSPDAPRLLAEFIAGGV